MAVRPPRARASPLVDIVKTTIIVTGAVIGLLGLLATIWGVSYAFARDGGGLETVRYCDKPCQAGEALISNGVCMTCVNLFEAANTISLSNTLACAAAGTCPVVNGFGSNLTVAAYAAAGLISINKTGGVIVISADLPSGTLPLCGACALQQSLRLAISGTCYECYTPTLSCTGGAGFCAVEDGVGGTQVLKKFVADDGVSISDYGNGTLRWHANVPPLPLAASSHLHIIPGAGSATVTDTPWIGVEALPVLGVSGFTYDSTMFYIQTYLGTTSWPDGDSFLDNVAKVVNNTMFFNADFSVNGIQIQGGNASDPSLKLMTISFNISDYYYGVDPASAFWNASNSASIDTDSLQTGCFCTMIGRNTQKIITGTCVFTPSFTLLGTTYYGGVVRMDFSYYYYDMLAFPTTASCSLRSRMMFNSTGVVRGPYETTPFF